jgi:hypothetical protein
VVIVGLNEDIELFNHESVDMFSTCHALLSDNLGDWERYFAKESYGIWLILLAVIYLALFLALVVVVVGPHYSCLVYGKSWSQGTCLLTHCVVMHWCVCMCWYYMFTYVFSGFGVTH